MYIYFEVNPNRFECFFLCVYYKRNIEHFFFQGTLLPGQSVQVNNTVSKKRNHNNNNINNNNNYNNNHLKQKKGGDASLKSRDFAKATATSAAATKAKAEWELEETPIYLAIAGYISYAFIFFVGYIREAIWGIGPVDGSKTFRYAQLCWLVGS